VNARTIRNYGVITGILAILAVLVIPPISGNPNVQQASTSVGQAAPLPADREDPRRVQTVADGQSSEAESSLDSNQNQSALVSNYQTSNAGTASTKLFGEVEVYDEAYVDARTKAQEIVNSFRDYYVNNSRIVRLDRKAFAPLKEEATSGANSLSETFNFTIISREALRDLKTRTRQ
jgi:hypothetical protein